MLSWPNSRIETWHFQEFDRILDELPKYLHFYLEFLIKQEQMAILNHIHRDKN